MFQSDFVEAYSTDDLQRRATNNICDLCALLWKTCLRWGCDGGKIVRFRRVGSVLLIDGRTFPVLSIVCGPSTFQRTSSLQHITNLRLELMPKLDTPDPYDGIQIGLPELPDPGSPAYIDILKQWLRDCDSDATHHNCHLSGRTGMQAATRVIPTILIEVQDTLLRLVQMQGSSDESVQWVALSYRGHREAYATMNNGMALIQVQIPETSLPSTFRDAVAITRALNIRYLWIHALCSNQDSIEDRREASQETEAAFGGAYCVLAACRGTNSYSGFLELRKTRDFVALRQSEQSTPFYICEMIDNFKKDVLNGPLHSRAWYMQEHALARRTIFFTESQMYWECGTGIRCETMTKMRK
jgi:hypothetical protein